MDKIVRLCCIDIPSHTLQKFLRDWSLQLTNIYQECTWSLVRKVAASIRDILFLLADILLTRHVIS